MSVLRAAIRVADRLADAGMVLAGIALACLTGLITVEVIGRNAVGVSTLVADEFSGYLLVAVTFLGVSYSLRTGGFVRVEVLYGRISGRARAVLELAITLLALAGAVVLDWYLWAFTLGSYRFGTTSIYFTQTPLWIPQTVMAVGGLVLVVQFLAMAGRTVLELVEGDALER